MGLKVCMVFLLALLINSISADEILGCGGFIKTDVEINFSLIEVKLYTKQGSLKYQTDCAPNNGYYMLPVYSKGEYVIKVDAPSGWTFEPMSYGITIDGKTDKCTLLEDINFSFTGFGVVGKVLSKGQDIGPAGVTLSLKSKNGEVVRKTTSMVGGGFTFEKVLPGDYMVEASHPVWSFESTTGTVSLSKETGKVANTIIVSGFDVKGKILSEGEPVSGVNFFLFSSNDDVELKGCMRVSSSTVPMIEGHKLICSTMSDELGQFEFPAVVTGDYVLVPYYRGEKIKYDVTPSKIDVRVQHDSSIIEEPFQVAGFVVSGKVKTSVNGAGVSNAEIIVNGSPMIRSDEEGVFHLEAMKTGVYQLEAKAERMIFSSLEVKVTPNTPHLPDLVAVEFEVCGKIIINETYKMFSSGSRDVIFHDGKGNKYAEVKSRKDGSFCVFAAPGSYKCSVKVSDEERKTGFILVPFQNLVKVSDSPVDGITFSQFHAKVSGVVKCLENCGSLQLVLQSSMKSEEPKTLEMFSDSESVTFEFENIMAGSYELTIQNEKWCWSEASLQVDVVGEDASGLEFVQSGYKVVVSLSHDACLTFEPLSKKDQSLNFELIRGGNNFCVKEAGVYLVGMESCHRFESESYKYDTSLGGVLALEAVLHKVEIIVTTNSEYNDIMAIISSQDGEIAEVGPLMLSKIEGKKFEYSFDYWTKSSETLSISLVSSVLLVYPQSVQLDVNSDLCPSGRATFVGRQGAFVEGEISPPLAGVDVSVSMSNGKSLSTVTNEDGKYKVGPIDASLKHETSVSKSGYVFSEVTDQTGLFKVSKLAEIIVKVSEDGTGVDLSGVLLSLSGGGGFRRNNVTQDNESLAFTNLGPGQYFLKPMMKEYEFEPSSKFIEVKEGETVYVDIIAKKVAFSCYVHVTSLNGEAEVGVYLEAVNEGGDDDDACKDHQEESKTGVDGSIRIRGLKPGCSYILRMKDDKDLNSVIERTSPERIKLNVKNEDIQDLKFIAFRRITSMEISGRVIVPQEHLTSIKVHLLQESNPDAPLHTANLGPSPFFYFSSIPIDDQTYVLKLTSTLSRAQYNFSHPELQFKADSSFKHFTLHFDPQFKVGDQELAHSSLLALPLTILILYVCYNRKQVLPFVGRYVFVIFTLIASKAPSTASSRNSPSPTPQPIIDSLEFLNEATTKKKQKTKKI